MIRACLNSFAAVIMLCAALAASEEPRAEKVTVYLISRGFHTGVVVPAARSAGYIAVLRGTEEGAAEFGWGEAYYYQAASPGCLAGARALFLRNRSVVRTELLPGGPERALVRSDFAVRFDLSGEQFQRLCRFIDESFEKKDGAVIRESAETDRVSYYTSIHTYNMFNTCNTWAAGALEAAGTGVDSGGIVLASQLFAEAKKTGTVIKEE